MSKTQITYNIAASMLQIVIGYVCTDIMSMMNLHFMGQYTDKYQTAAYGLVWLIINLCAVPLGIGINQGLNHQVSQAIGQQKNRLALTYLNFTFYSIIIYSLPFFLIIYYSGLIQLFTSDLEIIEYSYKMIFPLWVSQFILLITECIKQYLVAQQIFQPFPYIYLTTLIFHFLLSLFLFQVLNLGYIAIYISMMVSELFTLILLILYIYYMPTVKKLFEEVDWKCQILQYKTTYFLFIKESVPLILHIFCGSLVFYLLSLFTFPLGVNQANAQMAFANTSTIYFKFPISLSISLMSYVGNNLSQKNIAQAQQYILSGISVYMVILAFMLSLLVIFNKEWASIYTSDAEIQTIMLETLPYFLLGNLFFDGLQGTLSGALKGVNKQSIVSNQTLFSYNILGIPLILLFTFPFNLQLIGIWLGFGISNFYLAIYFMYSLYKLNWEEQVEQICVKIQQHENCFGDLELSILE